MTELHETGAGTDLHRDILTTLLPGFDGTVAPAWVLARLGEGLGGVCLFGQNIVDAAQLRELTAALRSANPIAVIAIDEEGGDVTRLFYDRGAPYPGNALLGRIDDPDLTERVARAVGEALVATGCTVAFAPDVDVNSNPDNPVIGVRSFGADPALAARHAAAWVRGLQSTGVAASAKHFPGHGDTATDSHLALPVVDLPLETLRERDDRAIALTRQQPARHPGTAAAGAGSLACVAGTLRCPPLSCRTSPPHGGRSAVIDAALLPATSKIGESQAAGRSPPMWGRCPAGQRGARRNASSQTIRPPFAYFASWKMMPTVWRWPERTRLTPWRRLTR